jgi:hypothetical protein
MTPSTTITSTPTTTGRAGTAACGDCMPAAAEGEYPAVLREEYRGLVLVGRGRWAPAGGGAPLPGLRLSPEELDRRLLGRAEESEADPEPADGDELQTVPVSLPGEGAPVNPSPTSLPAFIRAV